MYKTPQWHAQNTPQGDEIFFFWTVWCRFFSLFLRFVRPFERFMSDLMFFKNPHRQEMRIPNLNPSIVIGEYDRAVMWEIIHWTWSSFGHLCPSCHYAAPITLEQTHSTIWPTAPESNLYASSQIEAFYSPFNLPWKENTRMYNHRWVWIHAPLGWEGVAEI